MNKAYRYRCESALLILAAITPIVLIDIDSSGAQEELMQPISASDVLGRCHSAMTWREQCAYKVRTTSTAEGVKRGRVSDTLVETTIQFQPNNIELFRVAYILDAGGLPIRDSAYERHHRIGHGVSVARSGQPGQLGAITYNDRDESTDLDAALFAPEIGGPLDGYLFGSDSQTIVDLLRMSNDLTMITDPDNKVVNISGTTVYGELEASFAVNQQCRLDSYRLRKNNEDIFTGGKSISSIVDQELGAIVDWAADYKTMKYSEFGGHSVATAGELNLRIIFDSGAVTHIRCVITREILAIDESSKEYIDSPLLEDGVTLVDKNQSGLAYVWMNGSKELAIPSDDFDAIREEIWLYKSNGVSTTVQSNMVRYGSRQFDAYCGIYCVYAAAELLNSNIAPQTLLSNEYISSSQGSTIAELAQCIMQNSLYSKPIVLSAEQLMRLDNPAILHTRFSQASIEPDHFVLYLGSIDDQLLLLHPPNSQSDCFIERVDASVIREIWDGTSIIVSRTSINSLVLQLGQITESWRHYTVFIAIFAFGAVAISRISAKQERHKLETPRRKMIKRSGLLVTMSSCTFGLYIIVNTAMAYITSKDIGTPQTEDDGSSPTSISIGELAEMDLYSQLIFVDARTSFQYRIGHVANAINIPYNYEDDGIDIGTLLPRVTESGDEHMTILVYCDLGCSNSQAMADLLVRMGYEDVRVYSGEWSDINVLWDNKYGIPQGDKE